MDKRDRAALFRTRLEQAMQANASNQSRLARATQVDRSTISQILNDDGGRLPNAHVVGACAEALEVSSDWLLGLSDRPESASDLLANSLTVAEADRALVDERIFEWHQEADGYKIRHVPAALPDMLKTRDMLQWEYAPHLGRTTEQAINASEDRLDWMRRSASDYEIALPLHEIESFATCSGYYGDLPTACRDGQIEYLITLSETLYPRLRIYLFDARRLYSAPVTVFGPLHAVLYLGRNYLVFRDTARVRAFSDHFDALLREAQVTTRELPDLLRRIAG